jgi:Sensors of blue-light using FAD
MQHGSGAVYFLVYVSAAVTWFSESELRALLTSARYRNEHAGITGLLLYKDGNFMQAIEGAESAVHALYQRIKADRRHQGLLLLDSGPQQKRQFANWSMAFHDLSSGGGEMPSGYSRFMDEPLNAPALVQQPGRCHELLQMFKEID